MSAEAIARGLSLKRSGHEWVGACPSCGYRAGFSVTERDGTLLVHCAVNKCDWTAIRGALVKLGLMREEPAQMPAKPRAKKDTGEQARGLWNRSSPASMPNGATTIVVNYLRSRCITVPVPPVLHFVPDCWHRGTRAKSPAMIALVEHIERGPVAVHRIWLRADGSGKADLDPVKMTLGPSDGAAIRLASVGPHGELGVAEGIEDALSYMQLKGIPTWSALTAGGIERLVLPPEARAIYVALDNTVSDSRPHRQRRGVGLVKAGAFSSPSRRSARIGMRRCARSHARGRRHDRQHIRPTPRCRRRRGDTGRFAAGRSQRRR